MGTKRLLLLLGLAAVPIAVALLVSGAPPGPGTGTEPPAAVRDPGDAGAVTFPDATTSGTGPIETLEEGEATGSDSRRSLPLNLRVVDAEWTPVPGARLRAFAEPELLRLIAETITDSRGLATIPDLAPERRIHVRVDAAGFTPTVERCWADPADPGPWRIDLHPPVELAGTVCDAVTGEPIAGARISTFEGPDYVPGSGDVVDLGLAHGSAVTDPGGAFRVADCGVVMRVEAVGYAVRDLHRWGRPEEPTIALLPTGHLCGSVRDENGEPASGASVIARPASGPYRLSDPAHIHADHTLERMKRGSNALVGLYGFERTVTDEAGRYGLSISSGGAAIVIVTAPGHRPSRGVTAAVKPGGRTDLDLVVGPPLEPRSREPTTAETPRETVAITGRVVDESGVPVAGAHVDQVIRDRTTTVTGADGSFTLRVPGRELHRIRARAEGFFPEKVFLEAPRSPPAASSGPPALGDPVEIRIERKSFLRVPVTVDPGADPPGVLALEGRFEICSQHNVAWPEDGLVSLTVRAGRWRLHLRAAGYLPVVIPVVIAPAETIVLPEVRLDAGAGLEVRVVDAEGRPVKGAAVVADQREDARERDERQGGKTGAAGRVRVRGLVRGKRAAVVVRKDNFGEFRGVGIPPWVLEVRLVEHAILRGTVVDESGVPVSGARVRTRPIGDGSRDGPRVYASADAAGRFSIRIPPGRYRVEIEIPGDPRRPAAPLEIDARRPDDPPRRIVVPRDG